MKKGIHPQYYPDAKVTCACGHSWTTGSTRKEIRTDMCSECHPFYTGEQRIVDTAGQVERFERRLGQRREFESKAVARERKRTTRRAREVVVEVPGEAAAEATAPAEGEAASAPAAPEGE
jgi:large subunit ribosomal protein L31